MMRCWKATPTFPGALPYIPQTFIVVVILCQYCGSQSSQELKRFNSIYQQKCKFPIKCRSDIQTTTTTTALPITDGVLPKLQTIPPPKFCCGDCSCTEECHVYGTCCPDMFSSFPDDSYVRSQVYSCIYPQYRQYGQTGVNQFWSVWLIAKCRRTYLDQSVVRKCLDFDNLPPVFDNFGNHYKNLYCALCNSRKMNDLTLWKSSIQCKENVFLPRSKNTLLDDLLNRGDCNLIYFSNTTSNVPKRCESYAERNRCNVTGLWDKYDEFTEIACLSFSAPVGIYRNWFCYKCNIPSSDTPVPPVCDPSIVVDVFPSFSAILDFSPYEEIVVSTPSTNTKCKPGYVYDSLKHTCLEVICSDGWELVDETCHPFLHNPKGLYYRVFINFRPANPNTISLTFTEAGHLLVSYVQGEIMQIRFDQFLSSFDLYYYNNSRTAANKNGCKQDIDQYYVVVLEFCFDFEANDKLLIDKLLAKNHKNISIHYKETERQFYVELQNLTSTSGQSGFLTQDGKDNLVKLPNDLPIYFGHCRNKPTTPLVITMFTACPTVVLRQKEFNLTIVSSRLFIQEYNVFLERIQFLEINGTHKVGVCLDRYKAFALDSENVSKTSDEKSERSSLTPIGILSLVLIVLSLACLILTFVTFILFSKLRTKAGWNIIILCVLLFCAQFMFQFWIRTSDIDYWACALIGIINHTVWMCVFFWMNICSIHMFRVFRTLDQPGRKVNTKWTLVIYSLYTLFGSSIFVLMNIFVIGGKSNFNQLGYGSGEDCFISTSLMLGFTFALPCGLIIASNLVLFALVVIKIYRQPSMKRDAQAKETRNHFGSCVRLSTITGITWLLGFLFVVTRVEFLEYLFVVSNASQGVYIMLAFVCNKKVMRMYRKHFCTGRKKVLSRGKTPMNSFQTNTTDTTDF